MMVIVITEKVGGRITKIVGPFEGVSKEQAFDNACAYAVRMRRPRKKFGRVVAEEWTVVPMEKPE